MRARRRMFAIVTPALTGALLLAAPAAHASAAEPAKDQPTEEVATTAGAALEETSDLFGDLGGALEQTLNHGSNFSSGLHTATNPLGKTGGLDKGLRTSTVDAPKLSGLVAATDGVVGGVDDVISIID